MVRGKVIILDTSAFISGLNPLTVKETVFSVPGVKKELIVETIGWLRFETAVASSKLKIVNPKEKYSTIVHDAAKNVGDLLHLSKADIQILALALQLREEGYSPNIITDDFSIQNTAITLKLVCVPLAVLGIRSHIRWLFYCPACQTKYPSDRKIELCRICGSKVKRKPLSTTSLEKLKRKWKTRTKLH